MKEFEVMNLTSYLCPSAHTGNFSCNFLIFCESGKFSMTVFIFLRSASCY